MNPELLWARPEDDNPWLLPGRNFGTRHVGSRFCSRFSEVARKKALRDPVAPYRGGRTTAPI